MQAAPHRAWTPCTRMITRSPSVVGHVHVMGTLVVRVVEGLFGQLVKHARFQRRVSLHIKCLEMHYFALACRLTTRKIPNHQFFKNDGRMRHACYVDPHPSMSCKCYSTCRYQVWFPTVVTTFAYPKMWHETILYMMKVCVVFCGGLSGWFRTAESLLDVGGLSHRISAEAQINT